MAKGDKFPNTQDTSVAADVAVATTEQSPEERLAVLTATIGDKVFTFPTTSIISIHDAVRLSQYFMEENLKPGQVFTFNYTMNAMLIVPELGLRMDANNLTYTYDGKLGPIQTERLIHLVNSCALLVGDIGAKTIPAKMNASAVNCQMMLEKPIAVLKKDIMEILGKTTRVMDDGTIDSPAADLKALLEYETKNKNRKDIVDLLSKAMNKIQGSIEFIAKMTDVRPVGKSNRPGSTTGPAPKGNPMIAKQYL